MDKKPSLLILPFWVMGVAFSFALPVELSVFLWLGLAFFAFCLMRFRTRFPWQSFVFLAFCCLFLGLAYGVWRTQLALAHRLPVANQYQSQSLMIRVDSLSEQKEYATRFQARVLSDNVVVKNIILSDYQHRTWPIGSVWQIQSRLRPPAGTFNRGGFNRETWALSYRIDASGSVGKERKLLNEPPSFINRVIYSWHRGRAYLQQRIDYFGKKYPDGAALTAALTLGNRGGLTDQHWQSFRRSGLSHLISISGLHVGMVAFFAGGLCLVFLRFIGRFLPFRQPKTPKIVCAWFALLAAFLYAMLAGFSVPTQRSVLMIAVLVISLSSRRYISSWQIWWRALAWVLLFDPIAILSAGFYLSFGLVAALIAFSNHRKRFHISKLRLFFEAQYAATIASIVPLALFFTALPVASPLFNLIAIPWFSFILTPVSLLSLVLPIDMLLKFSIILNQYSMQILQFSSNYAPQFAVAQVPFIWLICGLMATIILLLPRALGLHFWSIIMLIALIFYQAKRPLFSEAQIEVVDIGQGLAIIVSTAQHNLLFDTGRLPATLALIPTLNAKGIRHLDSLILSHNDQDHDGIYQDIQAALPADKVWAGQPKAYPDIAHLSHCQAGKNWQWDGVSFEFLTPYEVNQAPIDNDASCVLHIKTASQSVLIPADATRKAEKILIEKYGEKLHSDILILGHHGSNTSTSAEFLDYVQPKYAIASSGFGNHFSHPHPKVLQRLADKKIQWWRTDTQGAIEIQLSQKPTIRTIKHPRFYWQIKPVKQSAYRHFSP